jgi:hypothetical protein
MGDEECNVAALSTPRIERSTLRFMGTYDVCETIIGFSAKVAINTAVGGPTSVVTGYHQFHFQLLARAIQESNRDEDLQKVLAGLRKNLTDMKAAGARILKALPPKPEPPDVTLVDMTDPAKNKIAAKRVKDFSAGVVNVLELLTAYVKSAEDVTKKTTGELAKVEKNLDMHKSRWDAMRKISNGQRAKEIQLIKLDEMAALSKQLGAVRTLRAAYDRIG